MSKTPFYTLERFDGIFESLSMLTKSEDINREFPSIIDYSSYELLEALKKGFSDKLVEYVQDIEGCKDEELLELYEAEIEIFQAKIDLCDKRINEIIKMNEEEAQEKEEEAEDKKIIFASSAFGNMLAVKDMEKISSENSIDLLETLKCLKTGRGEGNQEMKRRFSRNSHFYDIHERKRFQMRIYYQIIAKNVYYVIGALQKKDDASLEMKSFLENRKKGTKDEKERLTELFKKTDDESIKEQQELVEKHKVVYDEIIKKLEERKK